jgi:hypothetical protein
VILSFRDALRGYYYLKIRAIIELSFEDIRIAEEILVCHLRIRIAVDRRRAVID